MENVPSWVQVILVASAVVTALGLLWAKIFHPLIRAAAAGEIMLPLLQELTVKFRDIPQVFSILKEIVSQVRTDSGSSLLDTVNKIEECLDTLQDSIEKTEVRTLAAAQFLQIGLEADRQLSERDREQVSRLIREQDRLMDRMSTFERNAMTIAENLAVAQKSVDAVAIDLVAAQKVVDSVATDLAASHDRADAVVSDNPGAAADAASQSPQEEKND